MLFYVGLEIEFISGLRNERDRDGWGWEMKPELFTLCLNDT